jgi:hypothetical protein
MGGAKGLGKDAPNQTRYTWHTRAYDASHELNEGPGGDLGVVIGWVL